MTSLHEAAVLGQAEQGLAVVSTLRADHTIQSTRVNVGILDHPETGRSAVAFVTAGPVKRAHLRPDPSHRDVPEWLAMGEYRGPRPPKVIRAIPGRLASTNAQLL
jgi:hypothetical protein